MAEDESLTYGQLKRQTQAWRKASGLSFTNVPPSLLTLEQQERALLTSLPLAKDGAAKTRLEADLQQVQARIAIAKRALQSKPL